MKTFLIAGASLACAVGALLANTVAIEPPATKVAATLPAASSQPADRPALRYKLKGVDGQEIDLMSYYGQTLMIVPVAWDANRRQFEDLELFSRYLKDRGFHMVAVLTDDFGKEPRTDAEVVGAIQDRYKTDNIRFAARVSVRGPGAHPLFKYLATTEGGEVAAPFTKFLINRDGEVVKRWAARERLVDGQGYKEVDAAIDTPMK